MDVSARLGHLHRRPVLEGIPYDGGVSRGVVVVEVVFGYNALGQYLVDQVTKRDLPVVQAVGLIFAAVYIGLNIIADVTAIIANPRLRHPK